MCVRGKISLLHWIVLQSGLYLRLKMCAKGKTSAFLLKFSLQNTPE